MKNLWPEKFDENKLPTAKSIFEEQAKLLHTITEGIVSAEVLSVDYIEALRKSMNNDFIYRFDIVGKFLENYRFSVLWFSHDITLYPVKVLLDEGIAKELGIRESLGEHSVELRTTEDIDQFLGSVLNSSRLKNIIGSIIRLSH